MVRENAAGVMDMVLGRALVIFFALTLALFAGPGFAGEKSMLLSEDFTSLENWKPLTFPKIKRHTKYSIETRGKESFLRAEADASASALVFKKRFNVYEFSRVRWRWKVTSVYKKGDATKKAGDDYPMRVYVIFEFDPQKAGFFEKLKYDAARLIYGEYPPHSSLNYIWANRSHKEKIITSSYTGQVKLMVLEEGARRVGEWVLETADILADYKRAFGTAPPAFASLALMCDSDNTGERGLAYLDFIEVFK